MPKIVDHDAYRQELVEGAIELFSARGFGSVTMRQVASALGVSTGTVYHYFSSKKTLFEAAAQTVAERNAAGALEALVQASQSGAALPRVEVRDLMSFLLAHEEQQMRQFVVLIDYWRLHSAEERADLAPVLYEAHYTYAQLVARLLGVRDQAVGELVLSVLFNILEMRWFHGPEFDFAPQLALLERLVTMCRLDETAEEAG